MPVRIVVHPACRDGQKVPVSSAARLRLHGAGACRHKVRRGFIAEKYAPLVEALYSFQPLVHVETQVRFEDGRTGMLQADLPILEAMVVEDEASRRAA